MVSILIVDDQPYIQELFSQELMGEGYKVLSTGDAESAKVCLENSKPDLVLLDLFLNGFEGWNVLHEIKRKDPHLPVLIVTAYDTYADDRAGHGRARCPFYSLRKALKWKPTQSLKQ